MENQFNSILESFQINFSLNSISKFRKSLNSMKNLKELYVKNLKQSV